MTDSTLSDAIRNMLNGGCNHEDNRTNRSIKNAIIDRLTGAKDIIGHNISSEEAIEYERQMIILESTDEEFANALEVITQKVLEISPIKAKEQKKDGARFPWVGNPS